MQKTTTIFEDIAHLTEIRRMYNHFLASWQSIYDVENTTYIKSNLKIINISINKLHEESDRLKTDKKPAVNNYTQIINHGYTPLEDIAIMAFNADKRYRYRE